MCVEVSTATPILPLFPPTDREASAGEGRSHPPFPRLKTLCLKQTTWSQEAVDHLLTGLCGRQEAGLQRLEQLIFEDPGGLGAGQIQLFKDANVAKLVWKLNDDGYTEAMEAKRREEVERTLQLHQTEDDTEVLMPGFEVGE